MGEIVVFFGKHSPAEVGAPLADDFSPSEFGVLRHLVKPGKEMSGSREGLVVSLGYRRPAVKSRKLGLTVDPFFLLCEHWSALASSYSVDMGGTLAFPYSADSGETLAFTSYH